MEVFIYVICAQLETPPATRRIKSWVAVGLQKILAVNGFPRKGITNETKTNAELWFQDSRQSFVWQLWTGACVKSHL